MTMETVPGTLRGYRAWRWDPKWEPLVLYPVGFHNYAGIRVWDNLKTEASCAHWEKTEKMSPHPAPVFGCTCGVYARYVSMDSHDVWPLLGSIRASGRIVLQRRGFRAQFAQVEALTTPDFRYRGQLQELGAHYGVPVFNTFHELQDEFPPSDVSRWVSPSYEEMDLRRVNMYRKYLVASPLDLTAFKGFMA